jgi:hypothetical protein
MKSIIEEEIITDVQTFGAMEAERVISDILGESPRKVPKAVHYRNNVTDEKYLCLAGGFAWPGAQPGFATVIGVQEGSSGEEPLYCLLAEREDNDVDSLLRQSRELWQLYGSNCREIPWSWYGDPNNGLNGFIQKFNKQQEKRGNERPFFLTSAPHQEEPNRFEIYCRTIRSFLQGSNKRLVLGSCDRLRGYLDHLAVNDVMKRTADDHPAISALGSALIALDTYQPWLMEITLPAARDDEYEDWYDTGDL